MATDPSINSPSRPAPDDTLPDRVHYSMMTGLPISAEEAAALGPEGSYSTPVPKAEFTKAQQAISIRQQKQAEIDARIKADKADRAARADRERKVSTTTKEEA